MIHGELGRSWPVFVDLNAFPARVLLTYATRRYPVNAS